MTRMFVVKVQRSQVSNFFPNQVVEMILDRYWVSPAREQYFNDVEEGAENLEPGQAEMFLGK